MKKNKLIALWLPALIIIILDQVTKHLVRTTPSLQNWDIIPGWLSFHYTQNPGMALGMDWASTPVISVIAILATIGIIIYILRSLDSANIGYLVCMGLVLGGAFGNIIDRLVMGYIGSYGGLLEGHVIDFIHFTLRIEGQPVFPYIFNVADISISVAIISLLLFNQRILPIEEEEQDKNTEQNEFKEVSDQDQETSSVASDLDADATDTEEDLPGKEMYKDESSTETEDDENVPPQPDRENSK